MTSHRSPVISVGLLRSVIDHRSLVTGHWSLTTDHWLICGILARERGGRSSMAERPAVDRKVAGSKPVAHPNQTSNRASFLMGVVVAF